MSLSTRCTLLLCMTLSCSAWATPIFLLAPHCHPANPEIIKPLAPFLSQLRSADLAEDPSHISVLITVALNQKFGRQFKLNEVIDALDKNPIHPGMMSFYEVRSAIRKLGYNAVGLRFDHALEVLPQPDDMMFMIDDRTFVGTRVMVLVFAVNATTRNILYPNGYICAMPTAQFAQYFSHDAVLFVREPQSPLTEPLTSIPSKLTLKDFNLPPSNTP